MLGSTRLRVLLFVLAVLPLAVPSGRARAQGGVARELQAIASDGSTIRIGEVGGRIELTPARSRDERFGRLRVRSGLLFDARASARTELPAFITGSVGDVLHVDAGVTSARVHALRARGSRTLGRIVLGDATLEGVAVAPDAVQVVGGPLEPSSLSWRRGTPRAIARGRTPLCVSPGERCATLVSRVPVPLAEVRGHAGAWSHVVAETDGVRLEGWVRTRRVTPSSDTDEDGLEGLAMHRAPLGDGCPYYGRPALVAPGTTVHVRPGGPVWAHLPDDPDSVSAHDTRPGTPWVEITSAPGVQRAYPGTTCSLGWVPRDSVTWDVQRQGGLTLASERRGGRQAAVVRTAPAWLLAAGVQRGDAIVGAVVHGTPRPASNLESLRRALGIGGTFLVERDGVEHTVRVPLAEHCQEPGRSQPSACHPR